MSTIKFELVSDYVNEGTGYFSLEPVVTQEGEILYQDVEKLMYGERVNGVNDLIWFVNQATRGNRDLKTLCEEDKFFMVSKIEGHLSDYKLDNLNLKYLVSFKTKKGSTVRDCIENCNTEDVPILANFERLLTEAECRLDKEEFVNFIRNSTFNVEVEKFI